MVYIDDFTIQTIIGLHLLILILWLMYFSALLFANFFRSIFNLDKRKKDEK